MASSDTSPDVDKVPMVDIILEPPSNSGEYDAAEAGEGRHFAPDTASENTPNVDDPSVVVATASKHSKWGKLRQTVKATTVFSSMVSDNSATSAGTTTMSRSGRRKLVSQADDRRDSFLKRFSTRQSSCGTSYLQAASADATSTSNSNLEPDAKVHEKLSDQLHS